MGSIKTTIIKGGGYLSLVKVISQLLAIAVNIILARLLLPEDFGLVALSVTFIGIITLFTNVGFGSSIIFNGGNSDKELSSIYWLNFLLSLFSFCIIISTAHLAARFYEENQLTNIVYLSGINLLVTPLFIIQYKLLERDLQFKSISIINLLSALFGSTFAIMWAYLDYGVYALVIQSLVTTFTRFGLVLFFRPWLPLRYFNFREIKSMIWYSLKFKASSTTLYLERNIDYLILGKYYTSVILGYYAFAYNIMYTPVKRISYIFSEVLFPSFSSFKNDKDKMLKGYFKSVELIAMISVPIMLILAYNAETLIYIFFGQKWLNAIPIVKILCFAGAIQSISQFGDVIFASIGKPEISLYVTIGRTILTVLAIVIGVQYGVLWVAYLLVMAKAISFFLFLSVLNHHIPFSLSRLFNSLKGPIVNVVSLSTIYVLAYFNYLNATSYVLLFIMFVVALIVLYTFHKKMIIEIFIALKEKSK